MTITKQRVKHLIVVCLAVHQMDRAFQTIEMEAQFLDLFLPLLKLHSLHGCVSRPMLGRCYT